MLLWLLKIGMNDENDRERMLKVEEGEDAERTDHVSPDRQKVFPNVGIHTAPDDLLSEP